MNQDFRVSIGFFHHPKIRRLRRSLGADGVCSLLALWGFTATYKPQGHLVDMDAEDIELAADWSGEAGAFFDALTGLRLIDEDNGVFSIHDWRDHNGYACHAKERSEKARRMAEVRWGNPNSSGSNAPSNAPSMLAGNAPSPSPNPVPNPSPEPNPNPEPSPKPSPKKRPPNPPGGVDGPLCTDVISYLNEKAGKEFKPGTHATVREIKARANEGFCLDDFKRVIDSKTEQWGSDEKMQKFIRPQTLFGSKFEAYLNETAKPKRRDHLLTKEKLEDLCG